ncbi:hypothetical protein AURDEDRAFT_176809 [Auricularia subglabra TFB-10046 SS5]|uniref:Uncharacterized protein n=1 Tax=Auricularia subglabra (strain TFB-10046 / SS5) TaxID=717982 RepID=J0WP04_AURST|nr:hypothetical protein AURDEDRAFT_176809 [Auricularia subglabra TFB-10046 SS5]
MNDDDAWMNDDGAGMLAVEWTRTISMAELELFTRHPTCWDDRGTAIVRTRAPNAVGVQFDRDALTAASQYFRKAFAQFDAIPKKRQPRAFGRPCFLIDGIESFVFLISLVQDHMLLFSSWPEFASNGVLLNQAKRYMIITGHWKVNRALYDAELLATLQRDWPESLDRWDFNVARTLDGTHHWPDAFEVAKFAHQFVGLLHPLLPALFYRVAVITSPDRIPKEAPALASSIEKGRTELERRRKQLFTDVASMEPFKLCVTCAPKTAEIRNELEYGLYTLPGAYIDILLCLYMLGVWFQEEEALCARCKGFVGLMIHQQRMSIWADLPTIFGTANLAPVVIELD